jgi:CBS domain-containing protein
MESVKTLLKAKGKEIWSVSPEASVYDALELMSEKNIGAVLVLENDKPVGIFSERDYARSVVLKGRVSRTTPIAEIMSREIYYVRPEQSIEDCMALITEKHLRHLPVIDGERLIGLISIGDAVKAVISRQEYKIRQLENCITGYDQFHRF